MNGASGRIVLYPMQTARHIVLATLTVACSATPLAPPPASTTRAPIPASTGTVLSLELMQGPSGEPEVNVCAVAVSVEIGDASIVVSVVDDEDGPCIQEAVSEHAEKVPGELARLHCTPMNAFGAATGSYLHFVADNAELVVFSSSYGGPQSSTADETEMTEIKRHAIDGGPITLGSTKGSCSDPQ